MRSEGLFAFSLYASDYSRCATVASSFEIDNAFLRYDGNRIDISSDFCNVWSYRPFDKVYIDRSTIHAVTANDSNADVLLNCLLIMFKYRMLEINALSIHGAAIQYGSDAIIFCGFSGAGKSTQASLWRYYLGAQMINLDKPVISISEEECYVHGTPWSGKEYCYNNKSLKVKAIIFVEKSLQCGVQKLRKTEALSLMLQNNMVYPIDDMMHEKYVGITTAIAEATDIYLLRCTKDENAVECLFERLYLEEYKSRSKKRMKIRNNFLLRNIADEWIVIPRGREALNYSATILLNETGAFLWNCLQIERTMDELKDEMIAEYEVDPEIAMSDVTKFVEQLKESGVIE